MYTMATTQSLLALGMFIMTMISLLASALPLMQDDIPGDFNSSYFPDGFFFGSATAAYQVEGKANKRCRGPSTWDTFTHKYPERIADHSNGDVADDFYDHYRHDIRLMRSTGLNAFRFSISWSRLIPSGRIKDGVNEEGIRFYHNLIQEIKEKGLEPFATIFHWDVPQALDDSYGGFLSAEIADDYLDFANLCFEKFGNEVKHWITINEPIIFTKFSYALGQHAPGRCSSWVNKACEAGNSATEPYIVMHNLIIAHAKAVQLYRNHYQKDQNGSIGVTIACNWMEPYNASNPEDQDAAKRQLDFIFGWFMEPITYGHYPRSMQDLVKDRLIKFTSKEIELIKGSYDFLGLNYYTGSYASSNFTVDPNPNHISYATDSHVNVTAYRDGKPIGEPTQISWIFIYPEGLRHLLSYIDATYQSPTIYITENGVAEKNDKNKTLEEALKDPWREKYYKGHLWNLYKSIKYDRVQVKGFFAWSYLDNFEWANGYNDRFGLYFVNFEDHHLTRHAKHSVKWFKKFLRVGEPNLNEDGEAMNMKDV